MKTSRWKTSAATMVLCAMAGVPAWAADAPASARKLDCKAKTQAGGELIQFTCPLKPSGSPQKIRLAADFSGSHDDTKLSMKASLNGTPVECEPGSLTSSLYEDGDIRLHCAFQATAAAGGKSVLTIRLQWYHAQLEKTDFVAE